MPGLEVKSYKISSNRDNSGTYSVEIETSAHTIVYPKVKVFFGVNQSIAFPVSFHVLDDNGNNLFNYSLDIQNSKTVEAETEENN